MSEEQKAVLVIRGMVFRVEPRESEADDVPESIWISFGGMIGIFKAKFWEDARVTKFFQEGAYFLFYKP